MGCFSIACGATGVAMANDEVALIALVPTKDGSKHSVIGASVISNDGTYALYHPIMLPIFGLLDDYGKLEVVHEDANTRILEDKFKTDIGSIAEAIARGEWADSKVLHKQLSIAFGAPVHGMFVHRKAWDLMSTTSLDNYTGKSDYSLWDYALSYPSTVLTDMGFELQQEPYPDARYRHWYKHPEHQYFQVAHDGSFAKIIVGGSEVSAYSVKAWAAALKKTRLRDQPFPTEWEEYAKRTPEVETTLIEMLLNGHQPPVLGRLLGLYDAHLCERTLKPAFADMQDPPRACYDRKVLRGEIFTAMTAALVFGRYMASVNRLYMPTFCGTQYGNKGAARAVNKLTKELLARD